MQGGVQVEREPEVVKVTEGGILLTATPVRARLVLLMRILLPTPKLKLRLLPPISCRRVSLPHQRQRNQQRSVASTPQKFSVTKRPSGASMAPTAALHLPVVIIFQALARLPCDAMSTVIHYLHLYKDLEPSVTGRPASTTGIPRQRPF